MRAAPLRSIRHHALALLLVATCLGAGGGRPAVLGPLQPLEVPAAAGSVAPDLAVSPDGEVWLSWLEPRSDGHCWFKVSKLAGRRFGLPLTIAQGDSFMINWADAPGILAAGRGRLTAHWRWLDRRGEEAYRVCLSQSLDGGQRWSAPIVPHRDTAAAEHGFVSLAVEGEGTRVVWLDGRNAAGAEHGGAGATALRTARLTRDGALEDERELDPRVCDCCQTGIAAMRGGALVAYRDRDADEVRDISVIGTGTAGQPRSVHRDGWKIQGCPVNGPALAAAGERVTAAWYTAALDSPQVRVAFSTDGGRSFGPPLRLDQGAPLGRVGIVALPDGSALVTWLEVSGRTASLVARAVAPSQGAAAPQAGPMVTVAALGTPRSSGQPRVARAGNRAFFSWSVAGPRSRVQVAVADLR